eukprot:jgi/Chlat1/624/Chrsp103S01037
MLMIIPADRDGRSEHAKPLGRHNIFHFLNADVLPNPDKVFWDQKTCRSLRFSGEGPSHASVGGSFLHWF